MSRRVGTASVICLIASVALLLCAARCGAAPPRPRGGGAALMHPYPLWPSEPVPGWPGVGVSEEFSPERLAGGDAAGNRWPATYGQPEFLAYPGAVHHERNEWQRYVCSYPIYNRNTLRRNFILHRMDAYKARCVDWAEPVYYNPMYGPRRRTPKNRPPVKVLPFKAGGPPIELDIGRLEPSLYCLRPIYAAPAVSDPAKKKYVLFRLRINDRRGDAEAMNTYYLWAQTLDNFYAGQEFYFHAEDDRAFRAELFLMPESEADLLVYNVDVHDRFGECARRRGKRRSVLFDTSERKGRWERLRNDPAFREKELVSPDEQRRRDEAVWAGAWPKNVHIWGNASKYVMVPAPEEWARYPWTLRCKDGNFYVGGRQGRWGLHAYSEPARYTFKGGTVMVRIRDAGGQTRTEPLGPPQPGMRLDHVRHVLYLGKKRLRTNVADAWVAGAEILENGRSVGKAKRNLNLRWFDPGKRYFDTAATEAQDRVIRLGDRARGKLFYNATRMRALPNGRGLGRPRGAKSRSQWERDWAMRFIEGVYRWPSIQPKHNLTYMIAGAVPGAPHRPHSLDREWNRRYGWGARSQYLLEGYDQVFPVVDGNEELAQAVGRFVPWVKTPDDVIRLLDTYLVQDNANEIMHHRYYYDHSMHLLMMKAVVVQDDPKISEPWMEFLWTRMWEYPQALSGMADNIVTGATRDGGTTIGSFNYTRYPRHMELMDRIETYIKNGGLPRYNIAEPDRYRKVFLSPYFVMEAAAAGRHAPGIGDVGGSTQAYGGRLDAGTAPLFAYGWRWHRDPKFAFELVHTFGRGKGWTDAEWAEIRKAAEGQPDPYLQNRSRVLSDWSGYLEGGTDQPDFRFRRAAAVRVGNGWGHNHWDTLDLRLWAHGIVVSGDAGQRSAYGRPNHRRTRVHNTVEVDGKDWYAHSWIAHLFDAPDAHYLRAESRAPFGMEHVTFFRRQVALLLADPGRPSAADVPRKDPNVVTPDSYVLDVFRVSGGTTHTYCFHGACDDEFKVNVKNRKNMTGARDDPDEDYLRGFAYRTAVENPDPDDVEWAADCDGDVLQATWRVARWARHGGNPEAKMLRGKHGGAMTAERKYTRLHLLGAANDRILHGICQDRVLWNEHNAGKPKYGVRCLFAQRRHQQPSDTVFVALLETYGGEPQIVSRRLLPVENNETDARRAVAVEVKTANGHTDLLFADARPEKRRRVAGGVEVSAEFAYLSRDKDGLRHAALTNGDLLKAADIEIRPSDRRYGGRVLAVDYLKRRVRVGGRVPKYLAGCFFEAGGDWHRTSYEVEKVEHVAARGKGKPTAVLTLRKGLEIMRTRVRSVDPDTGRVRGAIAMIRVRGRERGLVASNDALTKFWRVAYVGGNRHEGHLFQLSRLDPEATGPVFTEADFPPGSGLSVWEFGVGDEMILRTGVSLRRTGEGLYEVHATTGFTLRMKARGFEVSAHGTNWRRLETRPSGGLTEAQVSLADLNLPVDFKLRLLR